MYVVLDNGKLACEANFYNIPRHKKGFHNPVYRDFQSAKDYAMSWLGNLGFLIRDCVGPFKVDYSGAGDFIEVRKL